ncbi:RICIN domain-containing protein [Actinoplanes missouriensis]|uniref:RICIN domain-containing protein n=1 Tax=Actinoplanes missouriensis TaxID=1866 RepID=UPI003404052F
MGSVGEDGSDNREPLLVRPFVLADDEPRGTSPSAQTWPADPTREIPTQVIPAVPAADPGAAKPRDRRRRPALLIGAGVAAVLAVAGYAVVRPALQPAVSTSLPDQSLPVVTGPAPSPSAAAPSEAPTGGAGNDGAGTGSGETETGGAADSTAAATDPATATPSATTTQPAAPTAAASTTTAAAPATTTAAAPPADLVPPATLVEPQGSLVSGNGLCLDLQGGEAGDGVDVHVDDCNGTSPQRWRLNSDKTLEVLDMCANMVGYGGVELIRCDTRTTAQWALGENGRLTNAANAMCLTDPYSGARPGKQVFVVRCTGANNQRWSFR